MHTFFRVKKTKEKGRMYYTFQSTIADGIIICTFVNGKYIKHINGLFGPKTDYSLCIKVTPES